MNWKRLLFGLWLIATTVWAAIVILWSWGPMTHYGHPASLWVEILEIIVIPPIITLGLGAAIYWAVSALKQRQARR